MINVYRVYDFQYNEKEFMKNFKKAIVDKGYHSLSLFFKLLKKIGINSYDTARSYYNMRRVIPFDVLTKLAIILDLDINKIMFPNSIPIDTYSNNIANNHESYETTFNLFNTIFYLYNDNYNSNIPLNISNQESKYKEIEYAANQLSLIISKYNFLLQKFYFADLSNEELKDVSIFSTRFLVNRITNEKLNWDDIITWKNKSITSDVLKDFYEKYTFSLHNEKCFELFKLMKDNLPEYLFCLINNLLPTLDRL